MLSQQRHRQGYPKVPLQVRLQQALPHLSHTWQPCQQTALCCFRKVIDSMGSQVQQQQDNKGCLAYWQSQTLSPSCTWASSRPSSR